MMKSKILLARAVGLALLCAFWLAPGGAWAFGDCPTNSAVGSDEPCLGPEIGELHFRTAEGKGKNGIAQWEFGDELDADGLLVNPEVQLVETKGNDCRPESGALVSYSEGVGFQLTLGEDGSGRNCGAIEDSVTFTYEVGAAYKALLDAEAKGDVDAKISLTAGGQASGEIWIRAGGAPPFEDNDPDCGSVRNALDPVDGFDGVLGGVDAYSEYPDDSPLCVNGCSASDSCPDSDDHFPIEHTFVHDSMTIQMSQPDDPNGKRGTLGLGGGLSGDPVANGTRLRMKKLWDGTIGCGEVVGTADFTQGFNIDLENGQAQVVRLPDDFLIQNDQDGVVACGGPEAQACTQATPFAVDAVSGEITFDADVSGVYAWSGCSVYKGYAQYDAVALDPEYGLGTTDYNLTATAWNELAKLVQKFKKFDDETYYLDICPANLLYGYTSSGTEADADNDPHNGVQDYPGLIGEDPDSDGKFVTGMCFKDPATGDCVVQRGQFQDGTPVPLLADMSSDRLRQFGCYFDYQIDYDPLNTGNLNEAAIRIWGLLYGDWTSLRPSL